jgi:uncharacterized protein
MRRFVLLLFALLAFFWWLRRLLAGARRVRGVHQTDSRPVSQGRMVRDRVCNTFLPQSGAIRLQLEGEDLYFCSEACRDRFLAENRG